MTKNQRIAHVFFGFLAIILISSPIVLAFAPLAIGLGLFLKTQD